MKLFKISLLLGSIFFSSSSVQADYYILCPTGDQINFEQDKDDKWKATAEFDNYKFKGSLSIKTGVDPKPADEGVPVGGGWGPKNPAPNFSLSCLYRVKNMNSALTLTTSFTNESFKSCNPWISSSLTGFRCEEK